ncbi:MAG: hypothetical protein AB7O26_13350 [Planctomycetaceae bacterium]
MQRFRNVTLLAVLAVMTTTAVYGADNDRRGRWGRTENWGKRARTERLAAELYRQANAICWEMNRYYQHNAKYSENYRQMYTIREGAKRIHDMVNDGYHRRRHDKDDRIEFEVRALDNLFHQIDYDVRRWRSSRRDRSRGADLVAQMDEVEDTLHRLMDDYGVDTKFRDGYGRRDRDHDHDHGRNDRGPRR